MRLPRKPPERGRLIEEIGIDRIGELLRVMHRINLEDAYQHWDKLRHLQAPEGLTHEEWWMLIKLQRGGRASPIPLKDTMGEPFTFWQTDVMSPALHKIDRGAGGSIGMPEPISGEETKNYYYINSLMQEAITSSQLEGAAVTREVAREMIRSQRAPRDTSERMIYNNYLTMQSLAEWKEQELSPELIFEIHRSISEGTLDKEDAAGRLRTSDEIVEIVDDRDDEILHTPPPADELPERLQAFCDFANAASHDTFIHPIIKAIILHFWIGYDHPFVDGNGRTARAIFYWYMLRQKFWLFEYISISEILIKAPVKYATAYLHTETDSNDLNYFIHYQLKVIERAVENLHEYIQKKTAEFGRTSQLLHKLDVAFNHRQEAIITKALKEPNSSYTAKSHQLSHKIAYATARGDLMELEKHGLLISRKKGKTIHYYPVDNLAQHIKSLAR